MRNSLKLTDANCEFFKSEAPFDMLKQTVFTQALPQGKDFPLSERIRSLDYEKRH
jgi:hypothetical protein